VWRCLHDSVFCGFDTIPACDRQTDRQTDGRTDGHTTTAYAALAQRRAVKISTNFRWIASEKACKDYSRLRPPKGSHVHRNVVVSKKWCMIHTLLLHTSNRKYHMAYRFVPSPMTLGDLEGHSPVAGLNKCNSTFRTVQLTRRVARSLGGSWASCKVRDRNGGPPEWRTQIVTFCVCGLQLLSCMCKICTS